ncbi:MAG: DNA polymerase domain-containing protein [Candidatus Binatia bacterium]
MPARTPVEGWVFDVQEETKGVGLWLVDGQGKTRKFFYPFRPYFYVVGNEPHLEAVMRTLHRWRVPIFLHWEEKRDLYSDRTIPCLRVSVGSPRAYPKIIRALTAWREGGFELYTCDIPVAQLFFIETGLFPMARVILEVGKVDDSLTPLISSFALRDSPWEPDYSLPPLEIMEIRMEGGKGNPSHRPMGRLVVKVSGEELVIEEDPISSLKELVSRYDPHVILSHWGDSYLMPNLQRLASARGGLLPFGREPWGYLPRRRGKSYFTYGKILFTASSYTFKGRWHLDLENSFIIKECGLEGLIELSRLSKIPVQRMARTSTGTCISAMQVEKAIKDGYLIPLKKSQVEEFKTADELLTVDKGGLTYKPVPGFYEEVAEIDFASMYPTLMAKFNLSPETVGCKCCPNAPRVPEAGYRVCTRRKGLIPKTIDPLLRKRQWYKDKIKVTNDPVLQEIYDRRQTAHKWCLVTTFGFLGYRNARFGKIEAHESTTAWGREMLLRAKEIAERRGYRFIHGLTDSLWVKREGAKREDYLEVTKIIGERTGIPVSLEGVYRWISFLPSRQDPRAGVPARFFGLFDTGKLKVRGLMVRRHDTPPFVKRAVQEMLGILSQAQDKREYKAILEKKVLSLLETYMEGLIEGKMKPEELAILRRLSHGPLEYTHGTMTAAVAHELLARGVQMMPGEAIEMVITDASAKDPSSRARALGFLDLPHTYDRCKYREIFMDAIREIDLDAVLDSRVKFQKTTEEPLYGTI